MVCCRAHTGICLLDFNNNIIIIIITDLYSAFRSKDTEVSRATVSRRWKSNCGSTDRDWPSTFALAVHGDHCVLLLEGEVTDIRSCHGL